MNSDLEIEIEIPDCNDSFPADTYADSTNNNSPEVKSSHKLRKNRRVTEESPTEQYKQHNKNADTVDPEETHDFSLPKSVSESIQFAIDTITTTFTRAKSWSENDPNAHNNHTVERRGSVDTKELLLKLAERKIQELGN